MHRQQWQSLPSRSDRYTYLPTIEVIRGMQRAGFLPFKATQSRCRDAERRDFTKHMIRFRHVDLAKPLNVGDLLPEIVLVNSHDGTSAYKLMAGIDASLQIANNSQRALSSVGDWSRLQLTAGEQTAFAEAAHTLRFGDAEGMTHTPITPAQLLQPRRSEDAGSDLWKTLNRVQENANRGGLHAVQRDANGRRLRRVTTREVKGIDQDLKLNRALWTLVERIAELKGSAVAAEPCSGAFPVRLSAIHGSMTTVVVSQPWRDGSGRSNHHHQSAGTHLRALWPRVVAGAWAQRRREMGQPRQTPSAGRVRSLQEPSVEQTLGGDEMNCAIYGRCSTRDRGQDVENQLHQLRQFAANSGYTIVREYVDYQSGSRADRDQFQHLFQHATEGRFSVVLFWGLDRFSREGVYETLAH